MTRAQETSTHRVTRPRNRGQHRTRRWRRRTGHRAAPTSRGDDRPLGHIHRRSSVKARRAVRCQVRTEPKAPGRPDAMRGAQALHGDDTHRDGDHGSRHAHAAVARQRADGRHRPPPRGRANPSCEPTGRPRGERRATSSTTRSRTRTWPAKPRTSARRRSHARDSSSDCRRYPVRSPGGRRSGDGRSACPATMAPIDAMSRSSSAAVSFGSRGEHSRIGCLAPDVAHRESIGTRTPGGRRPSSTAAWNPADRTNAPDDRARTRA